MASIDLGDIQGNILRAFAMRQARYLFLGVTEPDAARQRLLTLVDHVTSARPWKTGPDGRTIKPPSTLNLGFSFRGLQALGVPGATLCGFSPAFQEGMRARAPKLGDDGESGVEHWDQVWQGAVDMLVTVNADTAEALDEAGARLDSMIDGPGLEKLGEQDAATLGDTTNEHFGYKDGLGNPHVEGADQPRQTRTGKLTDDGQWVPLATGEFLLGHANEGREIAPLPRPVEFSRNGTFAAYRKLRQHVGRFRAFLAQEGARYPAGEEMLAAKLVGRWRDGTPLALSPYHPEPTTITDNTFTYGDDPEGLKCPLGAHIRRANPRAALGFNGKLVNRHRIIRRGLPYGDQLPEGRLEDDGADRGIIFLALGADLEMQFEFVLRQWMNYGNEFGLGNDKDVLIGNNDGTGRMLVQGDATDSAGRPPHICTGLNRFVSTRGGEYFFLPSISGMRMMAMGIVDAE